MQAKELKAYLLEDEERLFSLMRGFQFHDIWSTNDEIRCAVPGGQNRTIVSVKLSEELYATSYDDKHTYHGDLFGLFQEFSGKDFLSVIKTCHSILGLKYSGKHIDRIDLLKDIRKFKKGRSKEVEVKKFDKDFLDRFIRMPHASMIEEAISPSVLNNFDIMFDPIKDRIIFPHYDWEEFDKVVGVTGRTTMSSDLAKELGMPKYWNYIKGYFKTRNLYGYWLAKDNLETSKMIILFESEKSVLKQFTIEFEKGFSVAVGGHVISQDQVEFILKNTSPDVEVVIAFDKDIMNLEPKEGKDHVLIEECKRFSRYRKTSYIFDKYGVLDSKDSPIDRGVKRWNYLLKHRIEVK